ncbi:hypothetical protein N7G274_002790 [Stereocaulon virgatum]|uniref:Peptidase C15, pyroglutamyl peptidase I-like protein n=1 Tax=Stereocaulon virgatum TaxID=373712 RepID=A0ABR4AIL9_9LECA
MGSLATEADDPEKEINVLVTGFGPFFENKINPSYLIARSLPSTYEGPHFSKINIHTHPTPIIVAYSYVRDVIPKLLFSSEETSNYDMVLNIGMAPGRKFYALETCAHRDGYNKPDVEGKTLQGDTYWKEAYNSPEILHTGFDTDDVWRRWKSGLMSEDVRPSSNAGHYLCDFIYYTSMLEYWRRDASATRPCVFLHVPGGRKQKDVLRGKQVALGLIAACVGSQLSNASYRKQANSGCSAAYDFGDEGLS